MSAKKVFVALSAVIVLGLSGNAAVAQVYAMGAVNPCNLSGVNPAYHPDVFGNPAIAASYGFVQSRDGTWQVRPDCRQHNAPPAGTVTARARAAPPAKDEIRNAH